jgi:hypothetical protein
MVQASLRTHKALARGDSFTNKILAAIKRDQVAINNSQYS